MTKQEAIELENKCDELMSKYLEEKCRVSLALTGKLKIEFDGNYITINKKLKEVDYVNCVGYYGWLQYIIEKAFDCIYDHEDDFDKLIWSYEHIRELE